MAWSLGFGIRPSPQGSLHVHGGTNTGFRSAFVLQQNRRFAYVLFTNSDRGGALDDALRRLLVGAP